MNKRELIEHINNTLFDNLKDTLFTEPTFSITESAKDNKVAITFETEQGGVLVGGMLKKFEKVTIPQFVADWIKYCKNTNVTMTRALLVGEVDFYNYANQKDLSRLTDFFSDGKNQDIFARAWLDGYTVEKEKRYSVKIRGEIEENLLVYGLGINRYFFARTYDSSKRNEHTRKELEEYGFGWVFNCPGVEVKEMKE